MIEQLRQALKQEDTVLFIGSGISCWSGLPSWTGLLIQLADYLQSTGRDADLVRKEIKQDLLQAASYGFDQLTPSEIGTFIRGACQFGSATPQNIHNKIVSLGPRCFITTNYDQLLEESLRKWKHGRPFRVVTNKQPIEEADIIQSKAVDFIFKPHGDVGDVESIVLTRQQYRKLLENGEWKHALESLKTLLVTRRVVYLGFGLRDPDFLLLRDALANTWKGGTRDHYAIMADVSSGEVNYWRKHHGIHLIGYVTNELPDGKRDHSKLLELLDDCLQPITAAISPAVTETVPSELILSLLRYASGMTRFESASLELPLRVHSSKGWNYERPGVPTIDRWEHLEAKEFLMDGPQRSVLLGLPGAGKTYGLRSAVSRLAQALHDSCLAECPIIKDLVVPMFVDMKLYTGNLVALLETTLPSGVTFQDLVDRLRVKIFLDSFNEMPRDQWERGDHEMDIPSFIKVYPNVEIVIGSRTEDGLTKLALPTYWLDEIDHDFLERQFEQRGINVTGPFSNELMDLLRKPFYFHLVANGSVKLAGLAHPRDIYCSFFSNLSDAFGSRFSNNLDLAKALSSFAYESINRGEEALPVHVLYQSITKEMQSVRILQPEPEAIGNWLVSKSTLLPYSGGRVALFHQSVTEFLAANELARRFQATPSILKEKLALNRWDQTILLALSILSENEAKLFLEAVINADFSLALRATKYLEVNRAPVVAKLLAEIPRRISKDTTYDLQIASALEFHVPVTEVHEPELRAIMSCGSLVGGTAAVKLLNCKGHVLKSEMLSTLFERRSDYNYCIQLGEGLQAFVGIEDFMWIAKSADSIESEMSNKDKESSALGFFAGVSQAFGKMNLSEICVAFLPTGSTKSSSKARVEIVLRCIQVRYSSEALNVAAGLLLDGFKEAAFAIHMIASYEEQRLSWIAFSDQHVTRLVHLLGDRYHGQWALCALRSLLVGRPDFADLVRTFALNANGLRQAALFNALENGYENLVFSAFESLLAMTSTERLDEPTHLIDRMHVDWSGQEALFLRLMRLRDTQLGLRLAESVTFGEAEIEAGKLDLGEIIWWLDWLSDTANPKTQWWLNNRLSKFIAENANTKTQKAFLGEFNSKDSKYRGILARTILNARKDLTTDDFSEDALAFLIDDLSNPQSVEIGGLLLGGTATETFTAERLLPMFRDAGEFLRPNLECVLKQAGNRHRRRYIPT